MGYGFACPALLRSDASYFSAGYAVLDPPYPISLTLMIGAGVPAFPAAIALGVLSNVSTASDRAR